MSMLFGVNVVQARLKSGKHGILEMLVRRGARSLRLQKVVAQAERLSIPIRMIDAAALDELTDTNHQGIGLSVESVPNISEKELDELADSPNVLFLVLDGVTDPRNLGACLRSAATLGVTAVIIPKDRSASVTDAASKAASGADQQIPLVVVTNLSRCLRRLAERGVWIVGTVLDGNTEIANVDLTGRIAMVMGSEGRGIRQQSRQHCDYLAVIPMVIDTFGFNVSVATGICLYEAHRQRHIGC